MAVSGVRIHSLRLPFQFDCGRLLDDVGRIGADEWVPHYNAADYDGEWSGVALRSPDGSPRQLFAGNHSSVFADTPLLESCPYLGEVLRAFRFPLRAVRLLRLHAGSVILEHSDPALGFEDGEIRLHIPVQTSPDVQFYLDGRRVILGAGETWYLDLSRPHRVVNRGAADRVHLVIDGIVNDWVRAVFAAAIDCGGTAPSLAIELAAFEQFREKVFEDADLQNRLLATPDPESFVDLTVQLARELGFFFRRGDVESAIRSGRRAWSGRSMQA